MAINKVANKGRTSRAAMRNVIEYVLQKDKIKDNLTYFSGPYQYDDITEQNEYGFVAVKKDGKWGVIDQYGNTIVDPKYEFSDISKITVLGKWHSTEGINTAYFICE